MSFDADAIDAAAAEGDFYDLTSMVPPEDQVVLKKVRDFMQAEVAPIANEYWEKAQSPLHLVPKIAELGITGGAFSGHGCADFSSLLNGLVTTEISRVDPSFSTLLSVHGALAIGSIMICGDEEQQARYVPDMVAWKKIGCFGLTEPDVGSAVAQGLGTTATRSGDTWTLDGAKRWIGNATFADVAVIWARDTADDQVKGFLVDTSDPGFTATKIEGKIALRAVENAVIRLEGVKVDEADRLQNGNSFRDTAKVLRLTRGGVAWSSVGCAIGAYTGAREYAMQREQFGRPIAGFQLVQDLLSRMLANITASQALCMRLAQLQDCEQLTEAQASLAKMYVTSRTREVVQWGREVMGGNGILLENNVARFLADSEAVYSYEGTREINSLIVGRAITGSSAFV